MKTYIVKDPVSGHTVYESEFLAEAMYFAKAGQMVMSFTRSPAGGTEYGFVALKH